MCTRLLLLLILLMAPSRVMIHAAQYADDGPSTASKEAVKQQLDILEPVGSYGGGISLVRTQGTLACLAAGMWFELVDLSDPAHPRRLARVHMDNTILDLLFTGKALYVAVRMKGAYIYDITDPEHIVQRGLIPDHRINVNLRMLGPLLAVRCHYKGYDGEETHYDISDPWNPKENGGESDRYLNHYESVKSRGFTIDNREKGGLVLSTVSADAPTSSSWQPILDLPDCEHVNIFHSSIRINEPYALIKGGSKVWMLDMTRPQQPTIQKQWILPNNVSANGYLRGHFAIFHDQGRLTVYNLTDLKQTVPLTLNGPFNYERQWSAGNVLISANEDNTRNEANSTKWLAAYNLDPATSPTQVSFPATLEGENSDILTSGTLAFVASERRGLRIIDCIDSAHPRLRSTFQCKGRIPIIQERKGDQLILSDERGFQVIDFADPDHPRLISAYQMGCDSAKRIAIQGTLACVTNDSGWLDILDLTDPGQPQLLSDLWLGDSSYHQLTNTGHFAFVVTDDQHIQLIDIANRRAPVKVGEFTTTSSLTIAPIPQEPNLLAAAGPNGLLIYDLSNPRTPVIKGRFPTSKACTELTVIDQTAYLTHDRIQAVDLSNPAAPTAVDKPIPTSLQRNLTLATRKRSDEDEDVIHDRQATSDRFAYCPFIRFWSGGPEYGLRIVDISDPAKPEVIYETEEGYSPIQDIQVINGLVYLADSESGLVIMREKAPQP